MKCIRSVAFPAPHRNNFGRGPRGPSGPHFGTRREELSPQVLRAPLCPGVCSISRSLSWTKGEQGCHTAPTEPGALGSQLCTHAGWGPPPTSVPMGFHPQQNDSTAQLGTYHAPQKPPSYRWPIPADTQQSQKWAPRVLQMADCHPLGTMARGHPPTLEPAQGG